MPGPASEKPERTLDLDRHPWERQTGETSRSFGSFRMFRDLGPARNIRDVAGKPGALTLSTMRIAQSQWRWKERAQAWDEHVLNERDKEQIEAERRAVDAMVTRHLSIASNFTRLLEVDLARHLTATGADKAEPDLRQEPYLSVESLKRALAFATDLERKARGVPNYGYEHVEDDGDIDFDAPPQIEMFARQATEAKRRMLQHKVEHDDETISIGDDPTEGADPNLPNIEPGLLLPEGWDDDDLE